MCVCITKLNKSKQFNCILQPNTSISNTNISSLGVCGITANQAAANLPCDHYSDKHSYGVPDNQNREDFITLAKNGKTEILPFVQCSNVCVNIFFYKKRNW